MFETKSIPSEWQFRPNDKDAKNDLRAVLTTVTCF